MRTWRLETFRQAALAGGPTRAAPSRCSTAAETKLKQVGFSDLLVVENFPVALVAYGFTRLGRDPQQVMLRAFPSPKKGKYRDKTPIYISPDQDRGGVLRARRRARPDLAGRQPPHRMPTLPAGGSAEADLVRRRTAKAHTLASTATMLTSACWSTSCSTPSRTR